MFKKHINKRKKYQIIIIVANIFYKMVVNEPRDSLASKWQDIQKKDKGINSLCAPKKGFFFFFI
jgi:hypothetical protein